MYNYSAFQEIQHLPKLTKKWTAKRYHPVWPSLFKVMRNTKSARNFITPDGRFQFRSEGSCWSVSWQLIVPSTLGELLDVWLVASHYWVPKTL
jgi:hypothetical protein